MDFSKWAEAYPITEHTAPTDARVLCNQLFNRFGMPVQLLSDRGTKFESGLFRKLCRWMGLDNIRTKADRPSTNGMDDHFHRTLNAMLGKIREPARFGFKSVWDYGDVLCIAARQPGVLSQLF